VVGKVMSLSEIVRKNLNLNLAETIFGKLFFGQFFGKVYSSLGEPFP
jgi:hypothetical protein